MLTQEDGVLDVLAKGARKPGSRFAGASEPLAVSILHLATGKRTLFVTQAQPVTSFPGLRQDYERLILALALTEIAAAVLPHEQEAPEAFRRMIEALRYLEIHPKPAVAFVWGQLSLLQEAGFMPQWADCAVCGLPVKEAQPSFSGHAGGIVHETCSYAYTDRTRARMEVAYGIERMLELNAPPQHLKFAEESAVLLGTLWKAYAERNLPAVDAAVNHLRLRIQEEMARTKGFEPPTLSSED